MRIKEYASALLTTTDAATGINSWGDFPALASVGFESLAQKIGISTKALGAFTAAGAGIAVAATAISIYKKHLEDQAKAADEASSSYESLSSDIDSYKSKISELNGSLRSGNLTEEEAYNVRKQLSEIQDEIIEKYGLEAQGLDLLSQSADKTNASLNNILKSEAIDNLATNKDAYERAARKMNRANESTYWLNEVDLDNEKLKSNIRDLADQYADAFYIEENETNGSFFIKVAGDTTEAQEALNALYTVLENTDDVTDSFKDKVADHLGQLNELISEFGARYDSYISQSIVANDEYFAIDSEINGYIQAMNDAILKQDWGALRTSLTKLTSEDIFGRIEDVENDHVREFFENLIADATTKGKEYEAQVKIKTEFLGDDSNKESFKDYLEKNFLNDNGEINLTAIGNLELGYTGGASEGQITAWNALNAIANEYETNVENLVYALAEEGEVQLETNEATAAAIPSFDAAAESVKVLATAYGTATTAMQEMLSGGGLPIETTLALIEELGDEWTKFLSVQDGKVQLDTVSYLESKTAEQKAQLELLSAERDALQAEIAKGPDFGTGNTASAMATYEALCKDLATTNAEIEIISATLADGSLAVEAFTSAFETGSGKLATFSEITEAISTGGFTQTQALDWISQIPELGEYYNVATNTFTGLNEAITGMVETDVNSFIDSVNAYLEENADIAEEDRAALEALCSSYKELADETLSSNKALTVINKGLTGFEKKSSKVKKQVNNLWNSDEFADARKDLVDLAKKSGITADDILELAEDNEYLAEMLDQSGVSASMLAKTFENLSLYGSDALSAITEDAIAVNEILSEMDVPIAKATTALEKYQASMEDWEYDDSFNGYQEAYEALGEMFTNGEFGADFRRTIELLYGEGYGAYAPEELYKQYKQLGQFLSEDDNGLGFIQKLYANRDILEGTMSSVKLENGKYIWDIKPEDFDEIAAAFGTTEEVIAACVHALGMFGDYTEYDTTALIDRFKLLNMALKDTEGNAILSEQGVRSMLEALGLASWEIDQVVANLKEAEGIKFLDFTDTNWESVNGTLRTLQEITGLQFDGVNIGVSSLRNILAGTFGMAQEDIAAFITTLDTLGFRLVGAAGNTMTLDEAIEALNHSELENLKAEAESALAKFKELLQLKDFNIDFDSTNLDEIEGNIETIEDMMDVIRNEDGTINLSAPQYPMIASMLSALIAQKQSLSQPEIMSIDVSGVDSELTNTIGLMQQIKQNYDLLEIQIATGADTTQTQQTIDNLVSQVQASDPEVLATLGFKEDTPLESQIEARIEQLTIQEIEVPLRAVGIDPAAITEQANTDATVVYGVNRSAVDKFKAENHNIDGRLTYTAYAYYNGISLSRVNWNQVGTITLNTKVNGEHGLNGTANAFGTAHANGNWGTKKKVTALTGELGPEIMVNPNTGTWQTIGDHGAEFVNVPKGAIIFNHKQTEALLKYGRVAGRGKSFLNGTAYAGGSVSAYNPVTGKPYTSSYTSSKKSSSSGSAADDVEEFAETLDWIEVLIDRIERKISKFGTVAGSTFRSFEERAAAGKASIAEIGKEIDVQNQAFERYMQEAETIDIPESYKELIRNGAIDLETITDEELNENIQKYQELYEKAIDCNDATVELQENLSQAYQDSFDRAAAMFDGILGLIEGRISRIDSHIDMIEASGHKVAKAFYDTQIESQQEAINQEIAKRNELERRLSDSVASGAIKEGTEAWYEMAQQIQDCTANIVDGTKAIVDYKRAIQELEWDQFDATQEAVSQLAEEADFYIDLLSRKDLHNDKGMLTDEGQSVMGLHVQNHNTYMAAADMYGDEIAKIDEQLKSDPYNVDLIERRAELIDLQRDSISAAEDEKEAITSLVEEGIQIELENLSELIDKRKEALDSAKDMYDFNKKVKEQTEEIRSLEKQMLAYSGDTSEENRKRIQELTLSLEEANEDLEETQYDKYISDQKELLDNLYLEYETILNQRLDNIEKLFNDMIIATNNSADTIQGTINTAAANVGLDMSSALESIWGDPAKEKFANYYGGFVSAQALTNTKLGDISTTMTAVSTTLGTMSSTLSTTLLNAIQTISDDVTERYQASNTNSIMSKMQENSLKWFTADQSTRNQLQSENIVLADRLSALLGENVYQENGAWYREDGSRLYTLNQDAIISSIVGAMKSNAAAWATSTDSEKDRLSNQNQNLAAQIASLTGKKVTRDSAGVWYIDGKKLFEQYHSGILQGVVGGGTLKDNERLAVLLEDEIVMTKDQWMNNVNKLTNGVSDTINKMVEEMLSGSGIKIPDAASFINQKIPVPGHQDMSRVDNSNNQFEVNFNIDHIETYEDFVSQMQKDRKFGEMVRDMTIGQIAGGSRFDKNKYTW